MDPHEALLRLGGVASREQVLGLTSTGRLRSAVRRGEIRRVSRGRYVVLDAERDRVAAARLHGTLALRSAALHHGWAVKWPAPWPEIAVPRNRHRPDRRGVRLVWVSNLDAAQAATGPLETVVMSARLLPFDEALCIADSALRAEAVTADQLQRVVETVRGAGAARIRRVIAAADGRAANPFESVLRALTLDLGLAMVPQQPVDVTRRVVHPDLVDATLRLVLEADSWEWHTGKQAHNDDCWRYNALVMHGWTVLRFTWEQVMRQPDYVREVLEQTTRHLRHAEVPSRA